jgi:hypothetical protein
MLYLVLPYFNFNNSAFCRRNLDIFISNYAKRDNLKIIICEGTYSDAAALPDYSTKIHKHLKFKLKNILWVKENLINIAIDSIPEAEYIAWSDRDICFINPQWVEETIEQLKQNDIVQPWSEVIHINQDYEFEVIKKDINQNFCNFASIGAIAQVKKNDISCGASMGQIWAMTRKFYEHIEKINDIEIMGGADSIIANYCVLQNEDYKKNINVRDTKSCKKIWKNFREKFKDCKYGYVRGAIIHYWHGHLDKRQYSSRHKFLLDQAYDPDIDIGYDENGILYLTRQGLRLEEGIRKYFTSREIDGNTKSTLQHGPFTMSYTVAANSILIPRPNKRQVSRLSITEDGTGDIEI